MPLVDLLERFKAAHGVSRLIVMAQLRDYVARTAVVDVLEEIKVIWDEEALDVLIGVGMRGVLYYAVIAQKARMAGV